MSTWKNVLIDYATTHSSFLEFRTSSSTLENGVIIWRTNVILGLISLFGNISFTKEESEESASQKAYTELVYQNRSHFRWSDPQIVSLNSRPSSQQNESSLILQMVQNMINQSVPANQPVDLFSQFMTHFREEPQEEQEEQPEELERQFTNNIFDVDFYNHLKTIVENKCVEISTQLDHNSLEADVIIHTDTTSREDIILSKYENGIYHLYIPKFNEDNRYQSNVLFHVCMQLGASYCSLINTQETQITRSYIH